MTITPQVFHSAANHEFEGVTYKYCREGSNEDTRAHQDEVYIGGVKWGRVSNNIYSPR